MSAPRAELDLDLVRQERLLGAGQVRAALDEVQALVEVRRVLAGRRRGAPSTRVS